MKTFWALIGVLVLVTCGLFVFADTGADASGDQPGAAIGAPVIEPAPIEEGERAPEVGGEGIQVAADDAPTEQVVVSTADPVIREAESVEAGLEEMGIVVVDGAEAVADETTLADLAPVDERDGEQVVLDAILAQRLDDAGADEPADAPGVESDWIVAASDGGEGVGEQEAPLESEEVVPDEVALEETIEETGEVETSLNESSPAPAEDAAQTTSVTDAAPTDAPTPAAPEGIGGALNAIDALVQEGAAKAPAGPEGTVEVREDGSLLINAKTVVTGKGTEDSPYEVPWDLLVTSSKTYAPEKGKKLLPAWAKALDGKWVRVRGYLLLPVMASDSKELLVMLNQWDGCCIGVPPSPYDAAEVRLTRSVDESVGGSGFVSYGTIKGKLDVDPYISGGWLLGLYVIDDAELELGSGRKGT